MGPQNIHPHPPPPSPENVFWPEMGAGGGGRRVYKFSLDQNPPRNALEFLCDMRPHYAQGNDSSRSAFSGARAHARGMTFLSVFFLYRPASPRPDSRWGIENQFFLVVLCRLPSNNKPTYPFLGRGGPIRGRTSATFSLFDGAGTTPIPIK